MNCPNCGKDAEGSNIFCPFCGTSFAEFTASENNDLKESIAESSEENVNENAKESVNQESVNEKNEDISENEPKPKKKKKKGKIALIISLVLVVALLLPIVAAAIYALPFKATASQKNIQSDDGTLDGKYIDLEFNQPVKSILYAISPEDKNDLEQYQEAEVEETELFGATISFPETDVNIGKSTLLIYVESILGMDTIITININYDIGYVSPSDPAAIEEIAEGIEIFANELIVTFEEDIPSRDAKKIIESYQGEVVGYITFANQYQVKFGSSDVHTVNTLKADMSREQGVIAAEYNYVEKISLDAIPNDSKFDSWQVESPDGNNWGLECIDAPGAWEYNDMMTITPVGVIDSSIDYNHEDIQINKKKINFLPSEDFKTAEELSNYFYETESAHESICPYNYGRSCEYCGYGDHGTHCTGIIGATADNNKGVCGVNWKADMYFGSFWTYTKIGEAQITRQDCSTMQFYYNISWMVASGCRVISFSVGEIREEDEEAEKDGIESMNRLFKSLEDMGYDFLFVKAAGNNNEDATTCALNRRILKGECTRAHSIIVGAVENTGTISGKIYDTIYNMAYYSNYGDAIDITAPGSDIYSTVMGKDNYEYMSGTSMATPMVAGVASLVYSINPELKYDDVKTIVCSSYDELCMKKNGSEEPSLYGIVNAKNAVEAAIATKEDPDKLPVPSEHAYGFVHGNVIDAKTEEVIQNGNVIIKAEDGTEYIGRIEEGVYNFFLEPGEYTMTVISDSYISETIYGVQVIEGVTTYNIKLNMVEDEIENGSVSGSIIDAFDGSEIAYATIKVYSGIDNINGSSPIITTTSDSDGDYSIELPGGNYTLVLEKDGYLKASANILVIGGEYLSNQNCSMTPVLNNGEVRIVLTWGEHPSDLDSHLVGPAPNGGRFHTYWNNKDYKYNYTLYDNLDLDDVTSYGPETTSIYIPLDGTYTFYVHDYSNRDSTFSTAMAESGAVVTVYTSGRTQPLIFNVPPMDGTLWEVFTITNGQLVPVNTVTYESRSSGVGQN